MLLRLTRNALLKLSTRIGENDCGERFNARFRDEFLNGEVIEVVLLFRTVLRLV
jgi:hypothetical protein